MSQHEKASGSPLCVRLETADGEHVTDEVVDDRATEAVQFDGRWFYRLGATLIFRERTTEKEQPDSVVGITLTHAPDASPPFPEKQSWDAMVAAQFAVAIGASPLIVPGSVRVSMGPPLQVKAGGCSERGPRSAQEDGIRFAPELGVFAVADGVSDGGGGDRAADAAVECVVAKAAGREAWGAERLCVDLAGEADTAVRQAQASHWGRCQTTFALLVLRERQAAIAWCGDSRIYRMRDGKVEQLTTDHRYARHVLAKCLGSRDTTDSESEVRTLDLHSGDTFLLCTDGVGDTLPEERIRAVLTGSWVVRNPPAAQCGARWIVQESLQLGSRDNCTALVVLVGGTAP